MRKQSSFIGIAIVFGLLAIVNIFAAISPVLSGNLDSADQVIEQDNEGIFAVLAEDVGGVTQVTGIPVFILGIVMLAVTYGLVQDKPWALSAAIWSLGIDIVLKAMIIIVELAVGTSLFDLWLTVLFVLVEGGLIYLMREYREQEPQPINS